jgi:CBS domain-containing membrane protein
MTSDPIVLSPGQKVAAALREMQQLFIRHLPVVDQGVLVGLVSHRDLLACDDGNRRVSEVMSTDLKTVAPATQAYEAAYVLLRHKIGCVPVVSDGGRLVGIVTESDFVRAAYALLGGQVPIDELELEDHESERF